MRVRSQAALIIYQFSNLLKIIFFSPEIMLLILYQGKDNQTTVSRLDFAIVILHGLQGLEQLYGLTANCDANFFMEKHKEKQCPTVTVLRPR